MRPPAPAYLMLALTPIVLGQQSDAVHPPGPPLRWETLEARIEQEVEAGFSGAILLVHDGKEVINKGYGYADRDAKIPNTPETIFGIGSTPIDFTKAGILLLAQRNRLALSDPITRFINDVPEDKRAITLDHLMTGRSGLRNFHGIPGDQDNDHSWIDREEAVRRILAQELLFAPGTGQEHSHSAFGLLAAVIEIVSGETYQSFVRRELFAPAGMRETGFFGEPLPAARTAVAYGKQSGNGANTPPNWGKTSWLVMGSGGMTSTTGDIRRWINFVRDRQLIKPELADKYMPRLGEFLIGGDVHGYEIAYTEGPNSVMIAMTNSFSSMPRSRAFMEMAREIASLIGPAPTPFKVGVAFNIEDHVEVARIVPDSAAERAGLLVGDVILSIAGRPVQNDPLALLAPSLQSGMPVQFEIERDSKRLTLTVTPEPR